MAIRPGSLTEQLFAKGVVHREFGLFLFPTQPRSVRGGFLGVCVSSEDSVSLE